MNIMDEDDIEYMYGEYGNINILKFANMNVSNLYLSNCGLDVNKIKILSSNKTVSVLDVSCNYLTSKCVKYLCKMQLSKLDISINLIGNSGMKLLLKNKLLQELIISENNISDYGLLNICHNTTLTKLDISANSIKHLGAKLLAKNNSITTLDISYNKIGNKGLNYFSTNTSIIILYAEDIFLSDNSSIVKFTKNNTIKVLSVGDNYLENDNVILLSKMLLKELYISNNQFSTSGIISLAKNNNLLRLDVSNNNVSDLAIYELLCNKYLRYIKLSCYLQVDNFTYLTGNNLKKLHITESICNMNLMNFIKQNNSIVWLKICYSLDDSMTNELLEVLVENKSIRRLNLSNNNMDNIDALRNNTRIINLNVQDNKLDINSVRIITTMTKLRSLNISHNLLDVDSCNILSKFELLRELNIESEYLTVCWVIPFLCNYTLFRLEFTIFSQANDMLFHKQIIDRINNRILTNNQNINSRKLSLFDMLLL